MFRHAEGGHQLTPHIVAGRANHMRLTGHGRLQPVRVGRILAAQGLYPLSVYTSTAVRAEETGRITLDAMDLGDMKIIIQDELQELGHGPGEGKLAVRRTRQVFTTPSRLWARILEGDESMNDIACRGWSWLEREFSEPTAETQVCFVFT
jgi:broad specificity phosphatase PhoE